MTKHTQVVVGLVLNLMIFLTGLLASLESQGWIYQSLKIAVPQTWEIPQMREALMGGKTFTILFPHVEFIVLDIFSLAYLAIGLIVSSIGFWKAHMKGA